MSLTFFPPVKMNVHLKKQVLMKNPDCCKNLYSHSNLRSMVNCVYNTLKLSCFSPCVTAIGLCGHTQ